MTIVTSSVARCTRTDHRDAERVLLTKGVDVLETVLAARRARGANLEARMRALVLLLRVEWLVCRLHRHHRASSGRHTETGCHRARVGRGRARKRGRSRR